MKIVAIGGGDIGTTDEFPYSLGEIDKKIFALSGKNHPTLLFLSFNERANYFFGTLRKIYMQMGAQCTSLRHNDFENKKTVESKFNRADIIYINGGNTIEYMKAIKKFGLDEFLKKALERDVILCGISAGAICYHKFGSSDSRHYKNKENKFTLVRGLGFIDLLFSPHFSNSSRPLDTERLVKKSKTIAICADDQTAVVFNGEDYEVVKSNPEAKVYRAFIKDNNYFLQEIAQNGKINSLIDRN